MILVTDAMQALGLPVGRHQIGQMDVEVVEVPGKKLHASSSRRGLCSVHKAVIAGTDTLAGSVASMIQCVRNFLAFTGCSLEQALEAASLHPARALGIDSRKGTLDFGADADFVVLSSEFVRPEGESESKSNSKGKSKGEGGGESKEKTAYERSTTWREREDSGVPVLEVLEVYIAGEREFCKAEETKGTVVQ